MVLYDDTWGVNNRAHDYNYVSYSWIYEWRYVAPVVAAVFGAAYIASLCCYAFANARLGKGKTVVLLIYLTLFLACQIASGVLVLIYTTEVGVNNPPYNLLRGSTFCEVFASNWLGFYILNIAQFRQCTFPRQYYVFLVVLILQLAGVILCSYGLYDAWERKLFKAGSCIFLVGFVTLLGYTSIIYPVFRRKYQWKMFRWIPISVLFVIITAVYYIYLIFNYKVYIVQAHIGLYIGLCFVPKLIVLVLTQYYLIALKKVDWFKLGPPV
jgi:hypothetical protein